MFIKLLAPLIIAASLYAEATFDQVQSMINNKQFSQAKLALTIIDTNHPNSAKVQYTLAQVNAGLGDLSTAREHLSKAKALNPKLDFVPTSSVKDLESVLVVNTNLIKPVESSTFSWWYLLFGIISGYLLVKWYKSRKPIKTDTVYKNSEPVYKKPETTYKEPETTYKKPEYKYTTPESEPTYRSRAEDRSYSNSRTDNHRYASEVHHHHHQDNTLSTIATAGITAAAVTALMDNDKPTHSYEPDSSSFIPSFSWNDSTPSISESWNDDSSSSSSWSDSSSSSDSSWNDTSSSSSSWNEDSSSSSSWND